MKAEIVWHSETIDTVLEALESSPKGLSEHAAEQRLGHYGPNRLPTPPKLPVLLRFILPFHNIMKNYKDFS